MSRYSIDNSPAECTLHTETVEFKRSISDCMLPELIKYSLSFYCQNGVEFSVLYHSFIGILKRCGVSAVEYIRILQDNKQWIY